MNRLLLLTTLLLFSQTVSAEQRIKLQSSTITGNSELPKILYVVPWKNVPATEFDEKMTVPDVSADFIRPVDPDEFERQAKHYAEIINGKAEQ
jgi:hypothetical protein